MKYLLIFLLILLSCKRQEFSEPKTFVSIQEMKIGNYISNNNDFIWIPEQKEGAQYWIKLLFEREIAVYQFNGQCILYFFTNDLRNDGKIQLVWNFKKDCLGNLPFLNNNYNLKKYPKNGDVFSEYSLINDSVIKVSYKFPDWIDKVNESEKDSIFPTYFYLSKN